MERTSTSVLDTFFPHHHLHLVDCPARIHLCLTTDDELPGFWIFQLRIHYSYRGEPSHRRPLLLHSL